MIVYLDTGFFIDYFSQRSTVTVNLRTDSRRGRTVHEIQKDSNSIMGKLKSHGAITSVITVLEYKDNTYSELKRSFKGLTDIQIENVMKTKSEASILHKRCQRSNIQLIPLNDKILKAALENPEYDELEIDDAIHIQTARAHRAEIVVSTDSGLLKFDGKFDNMRIVDTNKALKLL